MKPIKIPTGQDDPMMFFFWSLDEALPFLIAFGIGIVLHKTLFLLIAAYIFVKIYRKLKDSSPDKFFLHTAYHYGLVPIKSRTLINPFEEKFIQ